MPTAAYKLFLRVKSLKYELRAGFPNLGPITLYTFTEVTQMPFTGRKCLINNSKLRACYSDDSAGNSR